MNDVFYRAAWVLFVRAKYSLLEKLGYVHEEFLSFVPFIVRSDCGIKGDETMFMTRVPSSNKVAHNLRKLLLSEEDYDLQTTRQDYIL